MIRFDKFRIMRHPDKPLDKVRKAECAQVRGRGEIAACRKPENKDPSLGFVKDLDNELRVVRRRACEPRVAEYLRLKTPACVAPQF